MWAYIVVLAVLWSLPWLGVECFFGWCVVQGDNWWFYAAMFALPVLLFLEFPLRLIDRMRGVDDEDRETVLAGDVISEARRADIGRSTGMTRC